MSALLDRIPWRRWQPKLFQNLVTYDRRALLADLIAGLTVGGRLRASGVSTGPTSRSG